MLKVEIISLEKLVEEAEGVEVLLPGLEGQLGIRTNHLPLITPLQPGEVVVKQADGKEKVFAVVGGFVEIFDNHVRVMTDSAEIASDLDELTIERAISRAQELKVEARNDVEMATALGELSKNLSRMKAIRRQKRNRSQTVRQLDNAE